MEGMSAWDFTTSTFCTIQAAVHIKEDRISQIYSQIKKGGNSLWPYRDYKKRLLEESDDCCSESPS